MIAIPERKIVGFHQDEDGEWVAELECGHQQHVRHDPPWVMHEWVLTREGRQSRIGRKLVCPSCGASERQAKFGS
jgi:Protein of unknown function (DUF3565)